MTMVVDSYVLGGSSGTTLRDLILADSPAMYLRLGEASGSVANNETGGTDGNYVGSHTLGNAGLYTGGPTSFKVTGSNGRVLWPDTAVPSLTNMTIGVIVRVNATDGNRPLLDRDDGGLSGVDRFWLFDLDSGTNLRFVRIVGGVEVVSVAHGLSAGDIALFVATYASTGAVKLYKNGTELTSATIASGLDFGATAMRSISVANTENLDTGRTDDRFSEAFVIPSTLTGTRIAEYATAAGL